MVAPKISQVGLSPSDAMAMGAAGMQSKPLIVLLLGSATGSYALASRMGQLHGQTAARHVGTSLPASLRPHGLSRNGNAGTLVSPVQWNQGMQAATTTSRTGGSVSMSAVLRLPMKATVIATIIGALFVWLVKILNTPSRVYDRDANTVGREYDAWTSEGILEYYWGEHIHLGYYEEGQRRGPFYGGKDFIQAKYDFIDKMLAFSKVSSTPASILDVGCGIGGTSRYLAKKFPQASVTGITISPEQQQRATALAKERGLSNVKFELVDALDMKYPDNSFDFVWACESGEHMPDKTKYVEEMTRVLKPGGRIVIATWCQREEPPEFTKAERKTLDYLYGEWTHPYFISIEEYARIMGRTGVLQEVVTDDWAAQTIPAWRQSIWVGVWDPWPVIRRPHLWWKVVRDAWCLEVMHRAFTKGLMQYGMMTAQKAPTPAEPVVAAAEAAEPVIEAAAAVAAD